MPHHTSLSLFVIFVFAAFQRSDTQGFGGGGGGGGNSSVGRGGALAIAIIIIILLVCCCCGCCFRKRIRTAYDNWRNADPAAAYDDNAMTPVVAQVDLIPTPTTAAYGPDGKPISTRNGIIYGRDGLPRP